MKKKISILLLGLLMTACNNSEKRVEEVKTQVTAIYTYEDNLPRVTFTQGTSDIVFESYEDGELEIDIELLEGQEVEKILISDGNRVLRVRDTGDKFILNGDKLKIFKDMVENGNSIKLKGKVSSYEYSSHSISKEDVEVIKRVFEEEKYN